MARRAGCAHCGLLFAISMLGGFMLASLFQGEQLEELSSTSPESGSASGPGSSAAFLSQAPRARSDEQDTFEPIIHDPIPEHGLQLGDPVARPRFYSTELGTHRKLYVAVLTSVETVGRQAAALNHTLAHITTSTGFFLAGPADTALPKNLHNVVIFPGEGENLPLKTADYLAEHFGEQYDYFFLVRDTSYVRGYRLQELAESLSVSQNLILGQPENGRCSIDGGILVSRQVVTSVAGRSDLCLTQTSPSGQTDDTALVRCMEQHSKLTCTDTAQGQHYVSRSSADYDPVTSGDLPGLITVRDVQESSQFNRLHATFSRLEIEDIDAHIAQLRAALEENHRNLQALRASGQSGDADQERRILPEELPWPVGSAEPIRTVSRYHINMWQRFTDSHMYLATPEKVADPHTLVDREDIKDVLELGMREIGRSGPYRLIGLKAGYRRFDGGRGMDYILDMEVQHQDRHEPELQRVEVHRPIMKAELVPVPFVTEKPSVTVVLPVTPDQISRAGTFVQSAMDNNENLSAVLYLISPDSSLEIFRPLVRLIQAFNKKSGSSNRRMGWMTARGTRSLSRFFILDAISKRIYSKALILLLDGPGLEYDSELFNRVRMQTIRGWEVFSPIPWIEYHPDIIYNSGVRKDPLQLHKDYGRFDGDYYGIMSFYLADYLNMREQTLPDIPRVDYNNTHADHPESHPYDLFEAFVRYSGLHVHRAVDPSFRLYYFARTCPAEPRFFHERACARSQLEGLGTQAQLAEAVSAYMTSQRSAGADQFSSPVHGVV